MWVKVDDGFVEHPKVTAAAGHLGPNSVGRVVAVWLEAICYAARNLTDGLVPLAVARRFFTDRRPLEVLDVMALPDVRLMTKTEAGYRFHDFDHYQPSAASIKAKRHRDRARKFHADSTRNPDGIQTESTRNRGGIHADSARNPERSRARDPVPSPRSRKKEQCADAHAACARVLVKLAHQVLDRLSDDADAPPMSELCATLKDLAAVHKVPYATGRDVTKAMDSALAQRHGRVS
jgi:hypothetical protein